MDTLTAKQATRAAKLARLERLQCRFRHRIAAKRTCVRDITGMDRLMATMLRMSLPSLPTFPKGACEK